MTNLDLAKDYVIRAGIRLKSVHLLMNEGAYPDVIRESQEIIESLLKGYIRSLKLDPPKWHDVGSILVENKNILHAEVLHHLELITDLSRYLRKERENAFYGDDDLIPLSSYKKEEAQDTLNKTEQVYKIIKQYV